MHSRVLLHLVDCMVRILDVAIGREAQCSGVVMHVQPDARTNSAICQDFARPKSLGMRARDRDNPPSH